MHRKYPVMLEEDGRLFYAVLDLVLETGEGLVLIQNSSFDSDYNSGKWENKALQLAGWLHLAGAALQRVFGKPLVKTYVHFVLSAVVVEVESA